jgi:hypothetical protein
LRAEARHVVAAVLAAATLAGCGGGSEPEATKTCNAPELPDVKLREKKTGAVSVDEAYATIDRLADEIRSDDDLAGHTVGERAAYAVLTLETEVENGGHFQFFFNAGDFTDEALAGLRLFGAVEYEQLLARAVAQFPGCDVPADLDAVQSEIDAMSTEQEAVVEAVDARYFQLELKKTLGRYAAEYMGRIRKSSSSHAASGPGPPRYMGVPA